MPALVDIPQRRSDIVRAVTDLALNGGLAAVTLRGVAERVGVSTSAVRATCPTRQRLLDVAMVSLARERATQRRIAGFARAAGVTVGGPELAAALLPGNEAERRRERLWLLLVEDPGAGGLRARTAAEEKEEDEWIVTAAVGSAGRPGAEGVLLLSALIAGLRRRLAVEGDVDPTAAIVVLDRALSGIPTRPAT